MGPPTHTQGSPRLSDIFEPLSAARACHARAAPALHSPHHVGRGRRPPPSQLSPRTVARPDPPLVRSQAALSQAMALPHSLPRFLPPQAPRHTRPCSRLEGPCTGGPIKALGEWEGLEKARRQDKRRAERREVLGRRKGLHVCTSPGRDTGDMGRARGHPHRPLQPLMTMALAVFSLPGDVICVCWCVSVGGFVRVPSS
jgi:hypothetical protein